VRPRRRLKPHARVRQFDMNAGLTPLPLLESELQDMMDVLLGREAPPIDTGVSTLMEVADAYFARASEISILILAQEREGNLTRASKYVKFRTGELRHFLELAKRAADLGSRRITMRQLTMEAERTGRSRFEPE